MWIFSFLDFWSGCKILNDQKKRLSEGLGICIWLWYTNDKLNMICQWYDVSCPFAHVQWSLSSTDQPRRFSLGHFQWVEQGRAKQLGWNIFAVKILAHPWKIFLVPCWNAWTSSWYPMEKMELVFESPHCSNPSAKRFHETFNRSVHGLKQSWDPIAIRATWHLMIIFCFGKLCFVCIWIIRLSHACATLQFFKGGGEKTTWSCDALSSLTSSFHCVISAHSSVHVIFVLSSFTLCDLRPCVIHLEMTHHLATSQKSWNDSLLEQVPAKTHIGKKWRWKITAGWNIIYRNVEIQGRAIEKLMKCQHPSTWLQTFYSRTAATRDIGCIYPPMTPVAYELWLGVRGLYGCYCSGHMKVTKRLSILLQAFCFSKLSFSSVVALPANTKCLK